MKKLFLSLVTMICISNAVSAYTFTGLVANKMNSQAIPYATVSLLRADSTLHSGTITDEKGRFAINISNDAQILRISFLGYKTMHYDVKEINEGQLFLLEEESELLDEVEVKASAPLVERKMDKIVVNVANSPFAVGNNGKELLKKAPGVNVDKDGKVTVNGKSVSVYIDGRPSYLEGEQLKAMLESTDGSTIDKIEIITQPSAKYDAAGQGGIINIKTKRNMTKGLNGSLSAGYGGMYWRDIQKYIQHENASLNLNYRAKKTYTSIGISQGFYSDVFESKEERTTPDSKRYSDDYTQYKMQYYNLNVSNDWYIDSANTLGFIVRVPVYMAFATADSNYNRSEQYQNKILIERNTEDSKSQYKWMRHTFNLNYTHVFNDSLDQEITVNVDYNRNNQNTKQTSDSHFKFLDQNDYLQLLTSTYTQPTNLYTAKADFQTQFWKTGTIECGAKWTGTSTDYSSRIDSTLNLQPAGSYTSDFRYSEHIAALYLTAAKRFGKHWNTKLGLRGEYTYSYGNWKTADTTTTQSYFNLFPTVFVGYNPTEDWALSVNYTRRISRPWYGSLNPAIRYSDAHTYSMGNPNLKPAFANNVKVSFGYSQYVTLDYVFSHTKGMFGDKIIVLDNGDKVSMMQNCGTNTSNGIYLSLTEIPIVPKLSKSEDGKRKVTGAWLALTSYFGASHDINRYDDGSVVKMWTYNVYGELNAYLPKDWTLSFDGSYYSPTLWGYSRWAGGGTLNFAVKKDIPKIGLTLKAEFDDILLSSKYKEDAVGLPEGYQSTWLSNGRNHSVSIGLTYRFGTYQEHKYRKVGSSDDDRLGSGGGRGK